MTIKPIQQENLLLITHSSLVHKKYFKPYLIQLGDIRAITLGSSPSGSFDSGGGSKYEYTDDLSAPDFPPPWSVPQP